MAEEDQVKAALTNAVVSIGSIPRVHAQKELYWHTIQLCAIGLGVEIMPENIEDVRKG